MGLDYHRIVVAAAHTVFVAVAPHNVAAVAVIKTIRQRKLKKTKDFERTYAIFFWLKGVVVVDGGNEFQAPFFFKFVGEETRRRTIKKKINIYKEKSSAVDRGHRHFFTHAQNKIDACDLFLGNI